jgi:hypothetical protein
MTNPDKKKAIRAAKEALREQKRRGEGAKADAIRAAEPKPKADGTSSILIRRNPRWSPRGLRSKEIGPAWAVVISSNQAYLDLPQLIESLRAAGYTDDQLKTELARRPPAIPLSEFVFRVSQHRDRWLKRIMDAEQHPLQTRTTVVMLALWHYGDCQEALHCFDMSLTGVTLHANPDKGVHGWTDMGGPDCVGMGLDYREQTQRMLL